MITEQSGVILVSESSQNMHLHWDQKKPNWNKLSSNQLTLKLVFS